MATWTPPTTLATGQVLSSPVWNAVANDTTFLYQAPFALYYDADGTECPAGTLTAIFLTGTTASNYGFSNPAFQAVVPLTGVYSVSGNITFTGATGSGVDNIAAAVFLAGDGALLGPQFSSSTSEFPGCNVSGLLYATAGQAVALIAQNNSGANLATVSNAQSTYLHISFVGSQ